MSESNMYDDTEGMGGVAAEDDTGEQDYASQLGTLGAKYDIPEATAAFKLLASSSEQARKALAEARAKILARKYNSAIPLLAASAALGAPTRAGSTAESFANMSGALIKPLEEKDQFERQQATDLLGIDTNMAGLDERLAQSQLSLASLKAKLAAQAENQPNERVIENGKVVYRPRTQARGKQAWTPAGSITNVNLKQEGAEATKVGELFGTQYGDILKAGIAANGKIAKYERLGSLLEGVKTGTFVPTITEFAAAAESLGFKVDRHLGTKQAADALSKEIALGFRNPEGGAGMPGSLSNADREFLVKMSPGLAKTPEGNRLILETAIKLARRDQEVAKLARDYRQQHGKMNEGFYDALQEYADTHPLFGDAAADDEDGSGPPGLPSVISPDEAAAVEPGTTSFYNQPKQRP